MTTHNVFVKNGWSIWLLLVPMQILLFVLLHETTYRLYSNLYGDLEPDLSWGIYVQYTLIVYIGIAVSFAIANILIKKIPILVWLIIEVALISYICLDQIDYRPHRSWLLLTNALIGMLLPLIVLHLVFRTQKSSSHLG